MYLRVLLANLPQYQTPFTNIITNNWVNCITSYVQTIIPGFRRDVRTPEIETCLRKVTNDLEYAFPAFQVFYLRVATSRHLGRL